MINLATHRGFGRALATHFGIATVTDVELGTADDVVLRAVVTVALTTDDLTAIAQLMHGATKPAPAPTPRRGELWIDRKNVRTKAVTDFDAWMHDRVDAEHAAFMARTSRHINLQEAPCAN